MLQWKKVIKSFVAIGLVLLVSCAMGCDSKGSAKNNEYSEAVINETIEKVVIKFTNMQLEKYNEAMGEIVFDTDRTELWDMDTKIVHKKEDEEDTQYEAVIYTKVMAYDLWGNDEGMSDITMVVDVNTETGYVSFKEADYSTNWLGKLAIALIYLGY